MSETDRQLKDKLNANQPMRERMCLELLQTEEKFSSVRPRLPNGGPDGGRDIEAEYDGNIRVFGAVGFVNNATDTKEHRKKAKTKFSDDLANLEGATPDESGRLPKAFCFFTNVGLTPGIVDDLKKSAYSKGVETCEIFDRERMRILLDRNTGYAIRFRYLDIPLSDAEQKDFFSAWGDQLQGMMASSLSDISATTRRLNFLAEAQFLVDQVSVVVKLDSALGDISGGKFLFQTMIALRVHAEGLLGLNFGAGNDPIVETIETIRSSETHFPRNSQYGYGTANLWPDSKLYERYKEMAGIEEDEEVDHWVPANSSSGILEIEKSFIQAIYGTTPFLERITPTCRLIDLDRSMILFDCSAEIADHIENITVWANGYRILDLNREDIRPEGGSFERFRLPKEAHQKEDCHEWRTIRPASNNSAFGPDFMGATPQRWRPVDV